MLAKKTIKLVLQMIGPLIFLYIILQINFSSLLEAVKNVKINLLLFSALVMILEIIIKSFRWQTLLKALSIRISGIKSIELFWLGAFVGVITPGRLGELIKIYFLKNKGYNGFRSLFSVIADRTVDVLFLLFLGVLIFFFYLKTIGVYLALLGLIFAILILFTFFLMNRESWVHKLFGRFVKIFFPNNFDDYSRFTLPKFWQGIRSLKVGEVVSFAIYLSVGWFLYFLARYAIALSLGLELSFVSVAIISVSIAIVSSLPISVAGLGTREAVVIYFFMIFGLSTEAAVLFSLLIFAVDLIVVSLGFIPYWKESRLINLAKPLE